MTTPTQIIIYGSTEFARVVKELVAACGYSFSGYIDDWHAGPEVLGTFEAVCSSHPPREFVIALAIGYKHLGARRRIAERLLEAGYHCPALVHPQAFVAPSARVDDGVMVMARAIIDVRAHLGSFTVVWPGAIISHDCELTGNTFVAPGATVCGHCKVGEDSFLGAGSIVVDHLATPKGTFLKAGSVWKSARPASSTPS